MARGAARPSWGEEIRLIANAQRAGTPPCSFTTQQSPERDWDLEDYVGEGFSLLHKGGARAAVLAHADRALERDPDCFCALDLKASAYAQATDQPADFRAALRCIDEAIAVAERLWPPWANATALCWGHNEPRPYLRLLHSKARLLAQAGELEPALHLALRLLRLNPTDNQGVRSLALRLLFLVDDVAAVGDLLELYLTDDTADIDLMYADVLLHFVGTMRGLGADALCNEKLKWAIQWHPLVPQYLLRGVDPEFRMPEFVTVGGADEAQIYALENRAVWEKYDAIDWLSRCREAALPSEAELLAALESHRSVFVTYREASGEVRPMIATRMMSEVPYRLRPGSQGHMLPPSYPPPPSPPMPAHQIGSPITVFDRDVKDWRSFDYAAVIATPFFAILAPRPARDRLSHLAAEAVVRAGGSANAVRRAGYPEDAVERVAIAERSMFAVGSRVCFHGLRSATDLNGCVGRILSFDEPSGRYAVEKELTPAGAQHSVKVMAANLKPVLSALENYEDVQALVDRAKPGMRVSLPKGNFSGDGVLEISSAITLEGKGSKGKDATVFCFSVKVTKGTSGQLLRLANFAVVDGSVEIKGGSDIKRVRLSGLLVSESTSEKDALILGAVGSGPQRDRILVEHCEVHGGADGVYINDSGVTLKSCTILRAHSRGIFANPSFTIQDSTVRECGGYGMKTRSGCHRLGDNDIQAGPWDGHMQWGGLGF